jgi:hypothetical protein
MATFGDQNWERLTKLKRIFDPKGLIRHNFWPLDEHGRPLGLEEFDVAQGKGKTLVDGLVDGVGEDDDYLSPTEEDIEGLDHALKKESAKMAPKKDKGKGREDLRLGNHFMDRSLRP